MNLNVSIKSTVKSCSNLKWKETCSGEKSASSVEQFSISFEARRDDVIGLKNFVAVKIEKTPSLIPELPKPLHNGREWFTSDNLPFGTTIHGCPICKSCSRHPFRRIDCYDCTICSNQCFQKYLENEVVHYPNILLGQQVQI